MPFNLYVAIRVGNNIFNGFALIKSPNFYCIQLILLVHFLRVFKNSKWYKNQKKMDQITAHIIIFLLLLLLFSLPNYLAAAAAASPAPCSTGTPSASSSPAPAWSSGSRSAPSLPSSPSTSRPGASSWPSSRTSFSSTSLSCQPWPGRGRQKKTWAPGQSSPGYSTTATTPSALW